MNKHEYDKIQQMHHQLYLMKKNNKRLFSQWKKARDLIEGVITTLSPKEDKLKNALELSVKALVRMQVQEDNIPLKRVHLNDMDGEPVWVVSGDCDGRWGIVNTNNESIQFVTSEGVVEEGWHDYNYIFRYKKEIKDYSQILQKYGIKDE